MNYFKFILAISLILNISACSKTIMTVKSNPTGAKVLLETSGISTTTDSQMELPEQDVFGKRKSINETFTFSKQGYKTQKIQFRLLKGKKNAVRPVQLEAYNTFLEINSTPVPIHIHFIPNVISPEERLKLPEAWKGEFTTPFSLQCTQKEAKILSNYRLQVTSDNIKGYIPTGNYIALTGSGYPLASSLKLGQKNTMSISLKPVVTTLQVVSEPPGAVVEDISTGGFGYLGTTPLIRNFNWEDVAVWSDRIINSKEAVGNKRKSLFGSSLYIDLRLSKPGYQDTYLRRLRLPVGEERSFHKNMNTLITSITFASDPAGVHVYVIRDREKETYDQGTGKFHPMTISFNKHLGTTPFTLNLDPNDPLQHGDKLIFEKSGYKTGTMDFVDGEANYYEVMVPVNIMQR